MRLESWLALLLIGVAAATQSYAYGDDSSEPVPITSIDDASSVGNAVSQASPPVVDLDTTVIPQ
jgi:hypothetical protein